MEGQIFLIRHKDHGRLSQEVLTTFLNSDKFALRLFSQNHQIYRREHLTRFLKSPEQQEHVVPATLVCMLLRTTLVHQALLFHTRRLGLHAVR